MTEISHRPTSIFVPALDYPRPLAKQVASYEAAHAAWRTAYAEVVSADRALGVAPEQDRAALVAAVAAGKDHPGAGTEEAARNALAIAEERCKVAREAATAETDVLRSALSAATEQLVPLVFKAIREAATAYDAEVAVSKARVTEARSALVTALGCTRMIKPFIQQHYGVTTDLPEYIDETHWKPAVSPRIEHRLDYLAGHIDAAKQGQVLADA